MLTGWTSRKESVIEYCCIMTCVINKLVKEQLAAGGNRSIVPDWYFESINKEDGS
jgi:hypothetical protein